MLRREFLQKTGIAAATLPLMGMIPHQKTESSDIMMWDNWDKEWVKAKSPSHKLCNDVWNLYDAREDSQITTPYALHNKEYTACCVNFYYNADNPKYSLPSDVVGYINSNPKKLPLPAMSRKEPDEILESLLDFLDYSTVEYVEPNDYVYVYCIFGKGGEPHMLSNGMSTPIYNAAGLATIFHSYKRRKGNRYDNIS